MQEYSLCISAVMVLFGAFVAFMLSKRPHTHYEMVDASEGDPAAMPKEEWRPKGVIETKKRNRKIWGFFFAYALLVLLGVGAWREGPAIVERFSPTATPTNTPMPTFTPRPSLTPTPTYWPVEVIRPSLTPRGPTSTPQVYVTTVYQQIPVTVVVVITRIFPVTVIVTVTPTGTYPPTVTPSPTPTFTETPSPTWMPSPSPTPTHTETPTP